MYIIPNVKNTTVTLCANVRPIKSGDFMLQIITTFHSPVVAWLSQMILASN